MTKIERIIVYSTLVVAFVLVAIFDFNISTALYQPSNVFGQLFEILAEIPVFFLLTLCCVVIAFHHPKPNKAVHWILFIGFLLAGAGVAFYCGVHSSKLLPRTFFHGMSGGIKWVVRLLVAAVVYGLAFIPARLVKKENGPSAFLFCIFFLVSVAICLGLMQGLKMIWLRPRFRTLMALQESGAIADVKSFWLPVWKPQFYTSFARYKVGGDYGFTQEQITKTISILGTDSWSTEEFYSFPSGHTMNSIVLLGFGYVLRLSPKFHDSKRAGIVFRCCIYVFALLAALSRIVRGAHCATDVVTGYLIGFLVFDLCSTFFYERFLKVRFAPGKPIVAEAEE